MKPRGNQKRRIKLINPRLQLRLVGVFLGLAAFGFVLQSLLVGLLLSQAAAEMEGGHFLVALLPSLPLKVLVVSFGLVLPLILSVGILVTHKFAGPVYRFEQFLRSVADGKQVGPCRLRKGDELEVLCALINEATEPLRLRARTESESETDVDEGAREVG